MRSLLEGFLRCNRTVQPCISLFYEEHCRLHALWKPVCPCFFLLCWWFFPSPTGLHIRSGCCPDLRRGGSRSCQCKDLRRVRIRIFSVRSVSIWQGSVFSPILRRLSYHSDRKTDWQIQVQKHEAGSVSEPESAERNLSQSWWQSECHGDSEMNGNHLEF